MLARTDNSTLAEMMAGSGFMAPRSGRRRDTVIASALHTRQVQARRLLTFIRPAPAGRFLWIGKTEARG